MKTRRITILTLVAAVTVLLTKEAFAFYNPHTGRWLSRDPIGEPEFTLTATGRQPVPIHDLEEEQVTTSLTRDESKEPNLYGFVFNDPRTRVDYLGLNDCPRWAEYLVEHPPNEQTREFMASCVGVAALFSPIPGDEVIASGALATRIEKALEKCKCLQNVRCKVALHGPYHPFPGLGKKCHIQVTCWFKGQKGSGVNVRIPVPDCACPKKWL